MRNYTFYSRRLLDVSTGPYYLFGGGIHGQRGFMGCMRHITIDGNYKLPGTKKFLPLNFLLIGFVLNRRLEGR